MSFDLTESRQRGDGFVVATTAGTADRDDGISITVRQRRVERQGLLGSFQDHTAGRSDRAS